MLPSPNSPVLVTVNWAWPVTRHCPVTRTLDLSQSEGVEVVVGVLVGMSVGVLVGVLVGTSVGVVVGVLVGTSVGVLVGFVVAVLSGVCEGVLLGFTTGVFVGLTTGVLVGSDSDPQLMISRTVVWPSYPSGCSTSNCN